MNVEYVYDDKTQIAIKQYEQGIDDYTKMVFSICREKGVSHKDALQQLLYSYDLNALRRGLSNLLASALPLQIIVTE